MATTINVALDLEPIACCTCGVWFALPTEFIRTHRRSGGLFYCPNGHDQVFKGGEVDSLKEELAAAREVAARQANRASALQRERDQLANDLMDAAKEHARVLRRANAGVCQHCHRHFTNVDRHVAKMHPAERAGVH